MGRSYIRLAMTVLSSLDLSCSILMPKLKHILRFFLHLAGVLGIEEINTELMADDISCLDIMKSERLCMPSVESSTAQVMCSALVQQHLTDNGSMSRCASNC